MYLGLVGTMMSVGILAGPFVGVGPAAVHDKQALVLVNRGGAKGSDIIALSDAVRASVREKFGIDIHPEVNFV